MESLQRVFTGNENTGLNLDTDANGQHVIHYVIQKLEFGADLNLSNF